MSSKPETNFIARVHKRLPLSVYHMKNHNVYTGGIADVWYDGLAGDCWVEYKYVDPLPVKVPVRPMELLSKLQSQWLNDRYRNGRNVAVIIGCKAGGVILKNKEWEHDIPIQQFNSLIRSPTDLADWIKEQVET